MAATVFAFVENCDSRAVYLGSDIKDGAHTTPSIDGGEREPKSDGGESCPIGRDDCDRDPSNGCETDLTNDGDHCGNCNNGCSSADCACQDGKFVARCPLGRADCNGEPRDGCEIDVTSDANHCGSCEKACPARGFDALGEICIDSRCMLVCEPSMADCDGDPATGCEAFLLFDNMNCGTCGIVCTCSDGRCTS